MDKQPISLRAYAEWRRAKGLPGASHEAVRRAIAAGRISASVIHLPSGKPAIRDSELADREWELATRPSAVAPTKDDGNADYRSARVRREAALAEIAELELAERKGRVAPIEELEQRMVRAFTIVRTHLLGIPSRIRQRLPHIAAEDVREIDDLIREALTELADGKVAT